MRSSNKFLSDKRFVCHAAWSDRRAPWMLFPAIWLSPGQEVAMGIKITRWTLGWLRWRFQLDWGTWTRPDPRAPIDWMKSGLDEFTAWGKQVFGQKWSKQDLERLFRTRPEWRRLVALGGARSHYIKLLLARELFQEPETNKAADEGLSALEDALDLDQTDMDDATWTISQRDKTGTVGPGTAVSPKKLI